MNKKRIGWAEQSILTFIKQTGCDREDALSDLLADLMHWADREGTNFEAAMARARYHYDYEITYPEEAS